MQSKWILPAVLAICAMPAGADEMPYDIGLTTGSFSVAQSLLTFTGTDPAAGITSGGTASLTNLGTFDATLPPANPAVVLGGNFSLTLTFLVPDGDDLASPIVATVSGTINKNNGNDVKIDFGVGQTINFSGSDGTGSFKLTVYDVLFPQFSGSASQTLTGLISEATLTPLSVTAPNAVPAPAPATLALLGIGLAGLGIARQRKAH